MKAIYINLDPYLAAFAAWIKGGKSGPAPHFDPLPLAVTIPLGVDAGYLSPLHSSEPNSVTINGQTIYFSGPENDPVATNVQFSGLSALAADAYYSVEPLSGASEKIEFVIGDGDAVEIVVTFTVLVRRETASGPVDLVDFTPPAAAPSAAAIKSALVAAGDGALAGVKLGGAILMITGDENTATKIQTDAPVDPGEEPVMVNNPKWANDNTYTVGGGAS